MGRKRHIVVNTSGLLLAVVVHPADVQDRDGARLVLKELAGRFPRLRLIWANGGYRDALSGWVQERSGCRFETVPRRMRRRRLGKDYEALPASSAAWGQIAMSRLMLAV